jgi:hypothetical protein
MSGVIILVGNYGSGKTEIAINLAIDQKKHGRQVQVADLDLVNPYFRTRQARQLLTELGIGVVLPPEHLLQADLPILSPRVSGMIQHPADVAILDVGGDDVGATVLAALADVFKDLDPQARMLQVVNPYRPNTDTLEGCLRVRRAIEASAQLPVSGWIGNTNIMDETTLNDIRFGYDFMRRLEAASGLPLKWISASPAVLPEQEQSQFGCPVLPMYRQLVPPWKRADTPIT